MALNFQIKKCAPIKLYNTLTRKKEMLRPIRRVPVGRARVGLYTCGPTVYNFAHIGNLRTYIFEDVLRRTLEYAGYRVRHVMNITDVDDKIIRDAAAADESMYDFVKPYEQAFFDDLTKLNMKPAWKYPKATDHIPDMVRLIQKLLKNGMAYEMDGSVYFTIKKFKRYGKLSRIHSRHMKPGTRGDKDEYTKHDIQDFVLWKARHTEREPFWDTPFGKGRPGWHIECSAMSMKYLGSTFDMHGGAVDLIFPHHENEIAQSEGATGKPFARFFVEGEHLLVGGEKMSKSLHNVFTLRDIEAKGYDPLAFRYLCLTAHYRAKLNFTWESLTAAQQSLERLRDFMLHLPAKSYTKRKTKSLAAYRTKFSHAILNDLDMPAALALVWSIMHVVHKYPNRHDVKEIHALFYDWDRVLGIGLANIKKENIPSRVIALMRERETYRAQKAWAEADALRKEIESLGYTLKDTAEGSKIKKQQGSQT